MLMLESYFDDSGHHRRSEIAVWGGILGETEKLDFLDRKWKERLDNPAPGKPPLKAFSLSDCKAGVGEFVPDAYNRAECDELRCHIRNIIINSGVCAIAYAVDARVWNDLMPPDNDVTPDMLAFGHCLMAATETSIGRSEEITAIFDKGCEGRVVSIIEAVRTLYPGKFDKISYGWRAVALTRPLQAADTIANEFNEYCHKYIYNPQETPGPHLRHLLDNIAEARGHIMGTDEIMELFHSEGFG